MRGLLIFGVAIFGVYWLDQTYYNGIYSHALTDMSRHIVVSYK